MKLNALNKTIVALALVGSFASTAYATTGTTTAIWTGTVPPVDAPADQWKIISSGSTPIDAGVIAFTEANGIFDVDVAGSSELAFNVVTAADEDVDVSVYTYEVTTFLIDSSDAAAANFTLVNGNGDDLTTIGEIQGATGPTSLKIGGQDVQVSPEANVSIQAAVTVSAVNL